MRAGIGKLIHLCMPNWFYQLTLELYPNLNPAEKALGERLHVLLSAQPDHVLN